MAVRWRSRRLRAVLRWTFTAACFTASCAMPTCAGDRPAAAPDAGVELGAAAADDDQPVYPLVDAGSDPVAQRYCALVHERAELKRKECCPATPFTPFLPTPECVRTLSHALRSAAVMFPPAELDACEAAISAEATQCDWGGSLPDTCIGVVHGRVAAGALCRSSLECAEGLHCSGLATTKPGRCAAAVKPGARCAAGPDSLAAFTRQDAEAKHPPCDGYCKLQWCAAMVPLGGACVSVLDCGPGRRCLAGKCSAAPFPAAGESCEHDACAAGLSCVRGTCIALKRLGDACAGDADCRSGSCASGKCTLSCDVIRRSPAQ